jgi:hypothetical protein
LVIAADPRLLPPGFPQTNATLVTFKINLPGMVEDILPMQPQTTNIAVVFGTSAVETFQVRECRREFRSFTNRVGFTWLDHLALGHLLERCADLPPRSFILNPLFVVDAAGVPNEKWRSYCICTRSPMPSASGTPSTNQMRKAVTIGILKKQFLANRRHFC